MNKIALSTAVLAGVLTLAPLSTAMAAPIQWSSADGGNDHWYELNEDYLSWDDARDEAGNRGGYLATITSEEENSFVSDLISGFQLWVWLGGTDNGSEGDWYWADGPEAGQQFWEGGLFGSAVGDYANWAFLEPNDGYFFGSEDYLAMWSTFGLLLPDGEWNDLSGGRYYSVIEYTSLPTEVPEPSTALLALAGLAGLALRRRRTTA